MESTDGALASPCLDLSKRDLSELPETRELQHVMVSHPTSLDT